MYQSALHAVAAALVLAGAASAQTPAPAPAPAPACVPAGAAHMIIARASLEPQGPGMIAAVAKQVMQEVPGSDMEAVVYPAQLDHYVQSQTAGLKAMQDLVNTYHAACPDSMMVLMGYSQGAHIAADLVCGASETIFPVTPPLDPAIGSKVAAVLLMGDPTHAVNSTFNKGNSTKDGAFPRGNSIACGDVTPRMASFCNTDDFFCDNGNSIEVHLSYIATNGNESTAFVTSQIKAMAAGGAAPAAPAVPPAGQPSTPAGAPNGTVPAGTHPVPETSGATPARRLRRRVDFRRSLKFW